MDDALVLREAFRHNAWANRTLIGVFRQVPRLELTNPFREGKRLLHKLNYLVITDVYFASALAGAEPAWRWPADETGDLDELETRVNHAAALWEEALARPIDASRMVLVGDGTYEFPVWAVLMQALKHGIAERTQICPPLAKLVGVAPPSLDPYAYATSTGRGGLLP